MVTRRLSWIRSDYRLPLGRWLVERWPSLQLSKHWGVRALPAEGGSRGWGVGELEAQTPALSTLTPPPAHPRQESSLPEAACSGAASPQSCTHSRPRAQAASRTAAVEQRDARHQGPGVSEGRF